ncbi:1185_t:CDS:2 [Rhizophagus irregularis]|nr:1185_t:CDS:2 [Rhizophagus irregularis]
MPVQEWACDKNLKVLLCRQRYWRSFITIRESAIQVKKQCLRSVDSEGGGTNYMSSLNSHKTSHFNNRSGRETLREINGQNKWPKINSVMNQPHSKSPYKKRIIPLRCCTNCKRIANLESDLRTQSTNNLNGMKFVNGKTDIMPLL